MNISRITLKIIASALIISLFTGNLLAQAWEVSADKANTVNPLVGNAEAAEAGKAIYRNNCKSCHGDPGQNNGLPLVPAPVDPAGEQMQAQTDGALFHKITAGRGAMVSFKASLSNNQRWQVISYIKSLSAEVTDVDAFEGSKVKLALAIDSVSKTVSATLTDTENNTPAGGIGIGLYVKRTFGNQRIAGIKRTDANGEVAFPFPDGIKGDEHGNVKVMIKVEDPKFPNVATTASAQIAEAVHAKNLLDERSLWTVRSNAPLWLIITYFSLVIGVWSFIGYIGFLVFRIYKEGQKAA